MSRLLRSPLSLALNSEARVRPLSHFEAAARGVQTQSTQAAAEIASGVRGRPTSGEINAPAYEVSGLFNYQSYFDSTLLEKAILDQAQNESIVSSTLSKPIMTAGYGFALAPSSQTPVAIQAFTGGMQGRSPTYRLKPGAVVWPFGRPGGAGNNAQFSGFRWGLPFGWLGGGSATLIVLRTADARVHWTTENVELIYHRTRMAILDPAAIPVGGGAYNGSLNWPQRFPWPGAFSGASSFPQKGRPALAISPTRTSLSLRMSAVLGSTMRMYFVGSNDFGQLSTGAADLTDVRAIDIAWSAWAQQVGAVAPFTSSFQTTMLTGEAERYAADAGAVALAAPAGSELIGQFVDVVRYGKL